MVKKLGRFIYVITLLAVLLAQVGLQPAVAAGNFTVNSTADAVDANIVDTICATTTPNQCTLRAAVQEANAQGGGTITIPAGLYTLTRPGAGESLAATGDLDIRSNITINGAGIGQTVIDANHLDRAFHVWSGFTLNLNGMTIQNGLASPGGAVLVDNNASIVNVEFKNNSSLPTGLNTDWGGAVFVNDGASASIDHSQFTGNVSSFGGGALATSNLSVSVAITNSTFTLNNGGFGGGAIYPNGSTATVDTSTFINNTANVGGAIHSNAGSVSVTNSTFVGNLATGNDGAIDARVGTITVSNSTFFNNSATGNGDTLGAQTGQGGALQVQNSILYGTRTDNCVAVTDLGHNLSWPSGNTCPGTQADPLLGKLVNNGGPTDTVALLVGSPAINAGTSCPAVDQRGDPRSSAPVTCDIGAFEGSVNGFIVTNTGDSGAGSLRQAIIGANTTGNTSSGRDEILFNIPGSGVQSIAPLSGLPQITDPVVIDGYSQPLAHANTQAVNSNANLLIQLSNTNNLGGTPGLELVTGSNGSLVRGLVINHGFYDGIHVDGITQGVIIQGNFIGTDASGTTADPNGVPSNNNSAGVLIDNNVSNVQIGGTDPAAHNIISGNNGDGIALWTSIGTVIQGNSIGVNKNGSALGNTGGQGGTVGGGISLRNSTSGAVIGGLSSGAGNTVSYNAPFGLVDYSGSNITIQGNTITNSTTSGIYLGGSQHLVTNNTISSNGGTGIYLVSNPTSIQNNVISLNGAGGVVVDLAANNVSIQNNSIFNNTGLGIDLGNDGVTFNHTGTIAGPNSFQNYPVLTLSTSDGSTTRVTGYLVSSPSTTYSIDVFSNPACNSTSFGDGKTFLGTIAVNTNANGQVSFDQTFSGGESEPLNGITATATGPSGTSEFSYCHPVSTPNLNWFQAQAVSSGSQIQQYITDLYQEKWFKFAVQPGSTVHVQLTGLPGSAVSLHRDPLSFYNSLINPSSAASLSASAADSAFLPSGSLPSGSLPSGSLPSGSLPSGSLPSGSLPTGFLPSGSLPSGSLPSGSLPSGSLPSGSLPSGSLPSGSLPSGSLPSGSLPSGSLPSGSLPSGSLPSGSLPTISLPSGSLPSGSLTAYASAARASLLGVAMAPNATVQTIDRNTYDYQGNLYVRVVGPYNLASPFSLQVTVDGGVCGAVLPVPGDKAVITPLPSTGTAQTLILTDSGRLKGTSADINTAMTDLQTLAGRSDVNGLVIDLNNSSLYPRVAFANTQADQNPTCPSAKNTVANEIQAVINAYRAANTSGGATTLKYVVLAGGADVIPFFQVQDVAGLASENNYVVPVAPSTPSDAGLQTNLVRGQDGYGSQTNLNQAGLSLPLPDLAVGRLVDTAADISTAVRNYIAVNGVITPHSSLVTGYDFVADAAQAIQTEMNAGTAATADTLIQPVGEAPNGPNAWTAAQLLAKLQASRHDIISLSGHFSAGNLVASDYTTSLSAAAIATSPVDLSNVLILALGCHSGYAIPSSDELANVTPDPDFAKAFLRKGAAGFVSASGYAYGDTVLTEYGERLFVELAQQLRTGTGAIAIGQALVAAKRQYLADTAQLTGIDQKTIVEMTLYGLPMMKVNMPGLRITPPVETSIVSGTTAISTGPATSANLSTTSVTLSPILTTPTPPSPVLKNLAGGPDVTTTYLSGADGVIANPFEPIYPKQIYNVNVDGQVLRGVALRGGTYADQGGIVPLTSAPATETSVANLSFNTPVFYPNQPWIVNFADALTGGSTRLIAIPAQFQSSGPSAIDGTLRTFSHLNMQLYYMPGNWTDPSSPATVKAAGVSAAPSIQGVSAAADNTGTSVTFSVTATADGSAGVQAVWVVYTGRPGTLLYGTWQPFDLAQNSNDPTHWTGTLALPSGATSQDLVYMVQVVGGAGLTALATNLGAYYSLAPANPSPLPTTLTLQSPPSSGTYLKTSTFTVSLTSGGNPLANQPVTLDIGGQQVTATTNSSGQATLSIKPVITPGSYTVQASFSGSLAYLGSSDTSTFVLNKDTTSLTISPSTATINFNTTPASQPTPFVAQVLDSSSNVLGGKSLFFVVHNGTNSLVHSAAADFHGNAALGPASLPTGVYTIDVYFNGTIPTTPNSITLSDLDYASSSLLGAATLTIIGDTTAPTISASAKKADNTPYTAGTWTNQAVTVHFTCGDTGSGIASCPADQVFSSEGTFTANGTATDLSNNSTPISFGPIKIDKTAPTITASAKNADGSVYTAGTWSNQTVTVHFTCADIASGVAACPADQVYSASGTFTANGTATDNAGNSANTSFGPIQINKTTVILRLLDSQGRGLAGGTAKYLNGTTLTNIPGSTNSNGDLVTTIPNTKGSLAFTMMYAGETTAKVQNVTTNSLVVFKMVVVTVQLKDHAGHPLDTGTVQFNNGASWLSFGTTSAGQVNKDLLPSVYGFRMIYAFASQDKLQINVGPTTVVFQTGQVHSTSGKATFYFASGSWHTFTQNMELLPLTYTFRFSDGTKDTNYTIKAGVTNNIH